MTAPRRSGGAVVISQVSAPDQISAPGDALGETSDVEQEELVGEAEGDA